MKTIIAVGLFIGGVVAIGGRAPAAAAEPCNPAGNLGFVCGPLNSEDLVQVPGTAWIVASGMDGGAAGSRGSLHLVDSRDKSWKTLFPGEKPAGEVGQGDLRRLPGPPDLAKFSAHGLNLRPEQQRRRHALCGQSGGRESIEIFALDPKGAEPAVTWVGCAVMPATPGPIRWRRCRMAAWWSPTCSIPGPEGPRQDECGRKHRRGLRMAPAQGLRPRSRQPNVGQQRH